MCIRDSSYTVRYLLGEDTIPLPEHRRPWTARKYFAVTAIEDVYKRQGYSAGYFSFNSEGGRCEECKGEGTITVETVSYTHLVGSARQWSVC